MSLVLAQSFMQQLRRLTEREQGMVSNTVLGLQYDPTAAKFNLHKVDGNGGWWSCYVNGDLRIIFKRNQPQKGNEKHMIICLASVWNRPAREKARCSRSTTVRQSRSGKWRTS